MKHETAIDAPHPETVTLGSHPIPLESSRPFALRFPGDVEGEFRASYHHAFRRHMQVFWFLGSLAALFEPTLDRLLVPELSDTLLLVRVPIFVVMLSTAILISRPQMVGGSAQVVTALAGVLVGTGKVILFLIVGPENAFPYFLSLLGFAIVYTIFITTLSFEYAAMGSLVVLTFFAATSLTLLDAPLLEGLLRVLGLAVVFGFSLSCTNVIERYARENFAQRRILEQQSAALEEKAHELAVSERRAQDANRAKSVFLSNMSHELRTPLNAVIGFAQLIERETVLSERAHENLEIIQRSGEHLLDLINDVLTISKIEAGRLELSEQVFDLQAMVRSVADMVRVRSEEKGLQFLLTVTPEVPQTVVGDEGKLRQVIINLLGNAVKFTEDGGIAMRVDMAGDRVLFEIEDTGHGISEEEIGTLFEVFTQTESGRNSKQGTGLGLAISRSYVHMMRGEMRVRSEVDKGTVFAVEVPLRVSTDRPEATARRRVVGLAAGHPAWRLLVVDDTFENRLLLTRLLGAVGFDVREATNGREAVEVWQEWRPDLIWMDMRMPVMDGATATRTIREMPGGAECRILALTASAFEHQREQILQQGVDDFVTKPFRENTIFEKLHEHLGVRFRYEEPVSAQARGRDESAGDLLESRHFSAISREDRGRLYQALELGDIEEAALVAETIRQFDPWLSEKLLGKIRAFELDDLLSKLEVLESGA